MEKYLDNKSNFNIDQAADFIGICHPTMHALVKTPGFPAFRIGKRWIIPRDALNRWLNERAEEHAQIRVGSAGSDRERRQNDGSYQD